MSMEEKGPCGMFGEGGQGFFQFPLLGGGYRFFCNDAFLKGRFVLN
jgi:hypothetical protein